MNPLFDETLQYCALHTTPPGQVLIDLERETHLRTIAPQMLSGPYQGQLLRQLSFLVQAQTILEIGTFTAYSTICLAEGLPQDGVIHTIEANEEMEPIIRKYISQSGQAGKIHLHIGDAKNIIPDLELQFDIAFIDARKEDYLLYYELVFDKVRAGGIIIADNVLWGGKVSGWNKEAEARVLDAYNKKVQEDTRVDNIILPIRDGLSIARKKQ